LADKKEKKNKLSSNLETPDPRVKIEKKDGAINIYNQV